jgi:hypothetical protein
MYSIGTTSQLNLVHYISFIGIIQVLVGIYFPVIFLLLLFLPSPIEKSPCHNNPNGQKYSFTALSYIIIICVIEAAGFGEASGHKREKIEEG